MDKNQKKQLHGLLGITALYLVLLVLDKAGAVKPLFHVRLYSFLVYLVPYLLSGWPVIRKAFLGIKNRQPFDESFLMFIATLGAFATGQNAEGVAVMLFYQIGEWFQSYAVGRSRNSIAGLMDMVPEEAVRENPDGTSEVIDCDDVEEGDVLLVKPGEKVPVDGTVLSGDSMVNTSALTGESVPRSVHPGDALLSGCINGEGLLRMRADKEFEDSTVAKILELVETASEKKSRTENFITRFARYYTPIVVYAALALAVIPSLITRQPLTWIYRACTFLVISCPCALVISVPLAFFGGIGAASKQGVLVKGSNYLELMANLGTVVSDKTGTLTKGTFSVTKVLPAEGVTKDQVLYAAAQAEGMSTHPIASSIRAALEKQDPEAAKGLVPISDTENIAGQGLVAKADGREICVGNAKLMEGLGISFQKTEDPAATIAYVAQDGAYLGAVLIQDEIKEESARALSEMKQEGVSKIVMLTGDRKEVGEAVGKELGVDKVYSELLPQDKVSVVEQLLTEEEKSSQGKKKLAFIGDGVNDAPVLSRADVGIAMGSLGSDAAIEAADIVIMNDNLENIPKVIRIARRTTGISTQNIVFALTVKILILVLGALGIAGMWAAVFADVGVAVLCILNSMRLLVVKNEPHRPM